MVQPTATQINLWVFSPHSIPNGQLFNGIYLLWEEVLKWFGQNEFTINGINGPKWNCHIHSQWKCERCKHIILEFAQSWRPFWISFISTNKIVQHTQCKVECLANLWMKNIELNCEHSMKKAESIDMPLHRFFCVEVKFVTSCLHNTHRSEYS